MEHIALDPADAADAILRIAPDRAIAFDLGGVLLRGGVLEAGTEAAAFATLEARFGVPAGEAERIWVTSLAPSETGELPEADVWAAIAALAPGSGPADGRPDGSQPDTLADDIRTAIRIGQEFGVDQIIEHGTEAFRVVDELLRYNIPVSCGPALVSRVKLEVRGRTFRTPGILAKQGVKVSIITDHPVVPEPYLVMSAALAVREGMEEADAIRAITQTPAELSGVGDRIGSIEPGKDGDLVIWNGHPFDYRSRVAKTVILGQVVYDAEHAGS
jgi:hypothetical protein